MTLPKDRIPTQLNEAAQLAVEMPERVEVRFHHGFWVVVKDGNSLRAFQSFLEAEEMAEAAWYCKQWARVCDGHYIVVDHIGTPRQA
jgi:hypothetical protein